MKNSSIYRDERYVRMLSGIVIFLLFPGFYFYQFAVSYSLIPELLGGFFGFSAVFFGIPVIALEFFRLFARRSAISRTDVLVVITICFMGGWAALHFLLGSGYQQDSSFFYYGISALFFWAVLHVAFRNVPIESRSFVWILCFSLAAMLILASANAEEGFFYAAQAAPDDVKVATYQGFARSALVTSMLIMCAFNGWKAACVFVLSCVLLFLLGARSEFLGFVLSAVLVMLVRSGVGKAFLIWLPLAALSIAFTAINTGILEGDSRILQILDITSSSSYLARLNSVLDAAETIFSNPFFGGYASDVARGGAGTYAHNALSAWVSYGVVGFSLFIWLIFGSLIEAVRMVFGRRVMIIPLKLAALGFSTYAAVLAISAKSVYDPVFAIAWGTVVAASTRKQR